MVDPTRLKKKGHGVSVRRISKPEEGEVQPARSDDKHSLRLVFTPRDGTPFFEDWLTEFADGRAKSSVNTWKGEVPARPELINDFMPALQHRYGHISKKSWASIKTALRALWRVLDELPAGFSVSRLADFSDAHGELLRRATSRYYDDWSQLIRFAREHADLPSLNWPANYAVEQKNINVIDKTAGWRIYNAVNSPWLKSLSRFNPVRA